MHTQFTHKIKQFYIGVPSQVSTSYLLSNENVIRGL